MVRSGIVIAFLVTAVLQQAVAALAQTAGNQTAEREFQSGYAGSLPQEPGLLARTYFDNSQVRALIYRLEADPLPRSALDEALEPTEFSIADLLRVKILSERDGMFSIGFNYFTTTDMKAVFRAAEKYVPKLTDGFLRNKPEFEEIFARYAPAGVSRDALAYVLIAGISLNWDGLKTSMEQGYRRPRMVKGNSEEGGRWQYSFWASEIVPGHSTKGYIWGSSTFPGGPFNLPDDPVDYSFSSYGDPYSDPRMNFPDLFYLPVRAMGPEVAALAERVGLRNEEFFGRQLTNVIGLERVRSVGALLFALRDGPKSPDALQNAVQGPDRGVTAELLELLEEIQYVEALPDGRYRLRVPVLDVEDGPMVDAALDLSRQILIEWLDRNFHQIRMDLSGLTAIEHGVPFESLFTQVWHEFFGLATHRLVEQGFMADPYDDTVKYKGSLGLLWRASLYDFDPG